MSVHRRKQPFGIFSDQPQYAAVNAGQNHAGSSPWKIVRWAAPKDATWIAMTAASGRQARSRVAKTMFRQKISSQAAFEIEKITPVEISATTSSRDRFFS